MGKIILSGNKNIRDFGGIKVKDGIIKSKMLIRSDSIDKLTEEDIKILVEDYSLSTIVDLRTNLEKIENEDVKIPNVKYVHLPVFKDSILRVLFENEELPDINEVEIDMIDIYKQMLSKEHLNNISKIINYILDLNDNQFSVLFHCTQGKDRTGVVSAILLMILGASKEEIIKDYMYTNNACESYKKVGKKFFYAQKEHIEIVFDIIENNWNSVDDFIENGIKIEKEKIEKFKKRIVE